MPEVYFSNHYKKIATRFLMKHPSLIAQYEKTLFLLQENPFHPSLRFHKLKGELHEYQSISVNLKYRIVIDFIIKNNIVILLDIGDHGEVY